MDSKALENLEFRHILKCISTYTSSLPGRVKVECLTPLVALDRIQERFKWVKEIKLFLWDKAIPPPSIPDLIPVLHKSKIKNSFLTPEEIFIVGEHLEIARRVYTYWEEKRKDTPHTFRLVSRLVLLPELYKQIRQTVNAQGEVLDSASPRLKVLRERVQSLKIKIKNLLNELLEAPHYRSFWQEKIISIRNGRYVISVKSEYQSFLKGLVHDYSRTKATCFIEPLEILPLNNELQMAITEAKEEEERVLMKLTKEIAQYADILSQNQEWLSWLDTFMAIARYTAEFDCSFPKFDNRIYFKKAKHPLLLWREKKEQSAKVVPINLQIFPPTKTLIVSGPNAGGKTVALKTMGLFILMLQSGIPVPAEEVYLPVFEQVFTDIGDEQDLEYQMSTFSAHLKRLQEIIEKADENTLVLIDEIGKGTNPTEGAALAMAFLDTLKEKGTMTVVTTHYDILKSYGLKTREVLNVAVGVDEKTLQPTYQLVYNTLGMSYALEVAEKFGVKREILEKARDYLKQIGGSSSELIHGLVKIKEELKRKKTYFLTLLSEVFSLKQRWEKIIKEMEERQKELYLREEKRIKTLLQEVEQTIKAARQQKQKEDLKRLETQRQLLHSLKTQTISPPTLITPLPLKPGYWVKLSPHFGNKIVQIKEIQKDTAEVIVGNLRWQVPKRDIVEIVGEQMPLPKAVKVKTVSAPKTEVYLLGKRTDEALPQIEKAIDTAVLCGLKQIRIVHGLGSGRLRAAIREYLKTHPQVTGFQDAHPQEGGQGVTVVKIEG
ncbi:MAG: endonuclease MutS2 [Candidatus Desulfofervidaceae bacterium]|nr:endonuclease MutS2 [Candidatus Desulfofervidaceae bacterium]